jgi:hypothetical protein
MWRTINKWLLFFSSLAAFFLVFFLARPSQGVSSAISYGIPAVLVVWMVFGIGHYEYITAGHGPNSWRYIRSFEAIASARRQGGAV